MYELMSAKYHYSVRSYETKMTSFEYFSILKMILLHQSYTTIWIYSDKFNSDAICEYFMEKHELQPKCFFDLNNFQNSKSLNFDFEQQLQDTLHIFFSNQSLNEHALDHLRAEDNIIVVSDNVDRIASLKNGRLFGRKILLITNLNLCLLIPSTNRYVLECLLFNSNDTIISNFVRNALSHKSSYSQYNMHGSVLRTFFRQKGAHSFITSFDNKLMFFGPDGFVAEQLGKLLNGTVNSNTDFLIDNPDYNDFFTNGGYPYNYFIKFYKELATTNVVSNLKQSKSEYADLYMSSQLLSSHEKHRSNKSTEFLYPHITECLRIIVPTINDMETFGVKLIKNHYCQTICLAFLLMNLFKLIFDRIEKRIWQNNVFTTLSIFLAQSESRSNRSNLSWESIWMWLLVMLSLLTTSLLSAICYKTIISVQFQKQINSLQDLIESNLTIFVSNTLAADIEAWGSTLNPKFTEKIVIGEKYYMLKNEPIAIVWPEGMAEISVNLHLTNVSMREMRLMKEPLYCGLVSHMVPFKSPLKGIVNTVVRRMIEHGLRNKQLEWSQRFFNGMSLKQISETELMSTSDGQTLTISKLSGVFIMYGVGICISLIVALIELLWNRICSKICRIRDELFELNC